MGKLWWFGIVAAIAAETVRRLFVLPVAQSALVSLLFRKIPSDDSVFDLRLHRRKIFKTKADFAFQSEIRHAAFACTTHK